VLGIYYGPIATLDFASLYPSIMIAYNLSFETLVTDRRLVEGLGQLAATGANNDTQQLPLHASACLSREHVHIFNEV
jgi:DNA polymerase elongation subunit (family B)